MTLTIKKRPDLNSSDSAPQKGKSMAGSMLLRIAISAVLLYWLLHKTDMRGLALAFLNANWLLLALAQVSAVLSVVVLTARWDCVLRAMGANVPFRGLLQSNFVGLYFNLFTPSNVGQDAARILDFRSSANSTATGLASVAVDRMLGLFGMLAFAVGTLPFAAAKVPHYRIIEAAIAFAFAVLFAVSILIWSPVGRSIAGGLARFLPARVKEKLSEMHDTMGQMTGRPLPCLSSVGLALVFQLFVVLTNYIVASAVGIKVSFFVLMLVVPLALIVASIPVSINGLGLREGAYVSLWGAFGVGREQAMVTSLIFFATWVVIGLMGMLVYLTRRNVLHSSLPDGSA